MKKKVQTYGITLIGFNPQYEDCVITRDTFKDALNLADKLIRSITNGAFSLMNELNTMQTEAEYNYKSKGENCFDNKYTIPPYFVNLLLKPYNMKIIIIDVWEDEEETK